MISSQLQESVDIRKLILVDNRVLEQIDMVHRLRQITERPAREADILGGLQLVIELE